MITAHHGLGEELLPALLGSGGAALSAVVIVTRARLEGVVRWLRRR